MKIFIFFIFILSTSLWANPVKYKCERNFYIYYIELEDESIFLQIKDRSENNLILIGDSLRSSTENRFMKFYFSPPQGSETILTFDKEDITSQSNTLFGWVDGNFGRGIIHDNLRCLKFE